MEIRMQGMMEEYKEVYGLLLKCRNKVDFSGYAIDEMGYHGWEHDKIVEANNIIKETERRLDEIIGFYQCVMSLPTNELAWKSVE